MTKAVSRSGHQLTIKQAKFARIYWNTSNATQAYREAYEVSLTTTDATINVEACRLLKNPKVALRLRQLEAAAVKCEEASVERIVAGLAQIAFADPRKLFDKNGNLLKPSQLDDDVAMAIAGIEFEEDLPGAGIRKVAGRIHGRLAKVRMSDRTSALDKLAKIRGLYSDAANVQVNVAVVKRVLGISEDEI